MGNYSSVDKGKDLNMIISNFLKVSEQSRAYKMQREINYNVNHKSKKMISKPNYVRSFIEYCTQVWASYQWKAINIL